MIVQGDCLEVLRDLPDGCARMCVTSPPYWGLRDYGCDGQIGLEKTPEDYVASMIEVFREVRRVLSDDGTLWLNLGDSYAGSGQGGGGSMEKDVRAWREGCARADGKVRGEGATSRRNRNGVGPVPGLKPKDLVGIPWMVAFALRADGWYLRQEIIWHKPNPMPESVRDRFTKSHEHIFLLSKSPRYYWDAEAAQEPVAGNFKPNHRRTVLDNATDGLPPGASPHKGLRATAVRETRNRRDVWTISTKPFKGAHFATFPPDLVEPCVRIGSAPGDVVLDPFSGAGTVGVVCKRLGREHIGIELNPEYVAVAEERIKCAP